VLAADVLETVEATEEDERVAALEEDEMAELTEEPVEPETEPVYEMVEVSRENEVVAAEAQMALRAA